MKRRLKKKLSNNNDDIQQFRIYSNGVDIRWVMDCEDSKVFYISNPIIGSYPFENYPFSKCSVKAFRKWRKFEIGYSGSERPGYMGLG
ncbi:hypothetical protein OSJ97_23940 [Escherichia coli]|nr:hypothetical protein [Escherichia coli]